MCRIPVVFLAAICRWGFSAGGSADFDQVVKQSQGFESVTASYDCYGWSTEFPPEPATTLDKLVDGISKFSMKDGRWGWHVTPSDGLGT